MCVLPRQAGQRARGGYTCLSVMVVSFGIRVEGSAPEGPHLCCTGLATNSSRSLWPGLAMGARFYCLRC